MIGFGIDLGATAALTRRMSIPLFVLLLTAGLLAGCARNAGTVADRATAQPHAAGTGPAAVPPPLIALPGSGLNGKVAKYNTAGRFVVLDFPVGQMPGREQRLFVYRAGLKVGELRVTGPQRDTHIVADLTAGEAQPGDEVRDR